MTCDSCAKDITGALYSLPGINKVEVNVKDQLVSIEGTGSYKLCRHCQGFIVWSLLI
jgi:copper chaperone CopZ